MDLNGHVSQLSGSALSKDVGERRQTLYGGQTLDGGQTPVRSSDPDRVEPPRYTSIGFAGTAAIGRARDVRNR